MWDGDKIGRENLSASYMFPHQVGTHKSIALETNIRNLNGVCITSHMVNYVGQIPIHSEVVILAVDSLNKRRSIFESIMIDSPDVLFLIDIRVGGTLIEVFTVNLEDNDEVDKYRETLDYTPAPLPCGMKAFAPVAFIAAGLCCSILRNYWMDEEQSIPKEARFDILTFWNEFTFGG